MTDITELAQLRDRTVDYPYYLVECDCGKIYPSSELSGGEPMGDSGDYSDCYCPHCGEGEEHFAQCADPETAWKAQQDKIDALVEALEKAQLSIAELEREQEHLRPVGVMSEKAFHRLENSECRFIALWPRPGIFLPRKRPEDGVIVYARTAAPQEVKP